MGGGSCKFMTLASENIQVFFLLICEIYPKISDFFHFFFLSKVFFCFPHFKSTPTPILLVQPSPSGSSSSNRTDHLSGSFIFKVRKKGVGKASHHEAAVSFINLTCGNLVFVFEHTPIRAKQKERVLFKKNYLQHTRWH